MHESADRHERISPTAWGVAYQRTLTDIRLSQEIFALLDAEVRALRSPEEIAELDHFRYPQLTPFFEARYKLTNILMANQHADQILEIAAGFSPRGMVKTHYSRAQYVELDLPNVIREKKKIARALGARGNLHLQEGSALQMDDLLAATAPFKQKPITVLCEGLLRYLPQEEQWQVGSNIHTLLQSFGGAWITPDISARGLMATGPLKNIVRAQNAQMMRVTGLDIRPNYFPDEPTARAFFESMGFAIERHPLAEVQHLLVSPERECLTPEMVSDNLGTAPVYVMRPV